VRGLAFDDELRELLMHPFLLPRGFAVDAYDLREFRQTPHMRTVAATAGECALDSFP
jgi:hypothetical protein